jgi:hypothetical protein
MCYIAGLGFWLVAVTVYPPWIGISYISDFEQPGQWRSSGTFGITRFSAPIWNPPHASGLLPSAVRWPMQKITQPYCVEIATDRLLIRCFLGIIAIGVAVGGAGRWLNRGQRDPVVDFGWWLALGEAIVVLFLFLNDRARLCDTPRNRGAWG